MAYQLPPTALVHVLNLLVAMGLGSYSALQYRRERHRSVLLAFAAYMFMLGAWQLTSFVRDVATSADVKLVTTILVNTVVGPTYIYMFVWFVLAYADYDRWIIRRTKALAAGSIAVLCLLYALDPGYLIQFHGLATRGPVSVLSLTFEEWVVLERTRTPLFVFFQVYFLVISGAGMAILGRYLLRNRAEVAAGQVASLMVGIVTAQIAYTLVFLGFVPLTDDITDLVAGFLAISFAVAIFRYRLLDIAPVGRKQVVETMDDPVVLVDDGRVVDANRAARRLVDAGPAWQGAPVESFFAAFADEVPQFRDLDAVETEIELQADGGVRHFDLNIAPIAGSTGDGRGYVIVLREVTPLKEREQELDLLRQIQSRVLRHNIRNDLQTVRLYSERIRDTDEDAAEMASEILATTDGLLSVSQKARETERLLDQDHEPTRFDLTAMVREIVGRYRDAYPGVEFSVTGPGTCRVESIPSMEFAVENLVENAAQHNDGSSQRVDITISETPGETRLEIRDDGSGIPPQELATIESGEETPLEHGTGVGLWIVQWVADAAAATVEYETGDDGTVVSLRFPDPRSAA